MSWGTEKTMEARKMTKHFTAKFRGHGCKVYQFMSKRKFYTKAEQETLKVKQAERLKTWVTIFFPKILIKFKDIIS